MKLMGIRHIITDGVSTSAPYGVEVEFPSYVSTSTAPEEPALETKSELSKLLTSEEWGEYIDAHGPHLTLPLAEYVIYKITGMHIPFNDAREFANEKGIDMKYIGDLLFEANKICYFYLGSEVGSEAKALRMASRQIGEYAITEDALLIEAVHLILDKDPEFDIKKFI